MRSGLELGLAVFLGADAGRNRLLARIRTV
jgi:hypothetical protein